MGSVKKKKKFWFLNITFHLKLNVQIKCLYASKAGILCNRHFRQNVLYFWKLLCLRESLCMCLLHSTVSTLIVNICVFCIKGVFFFFFF